MNNRNTLRKQTVSVIICVYTEARWYDTVDAVASLRQQTLLPDEIILVVDHNPALLQRARAELTDLLVVENSEPQGLSGARNSGIAASQSELLAFLDDDATAEPEWLERLVTCCTDLRVLGAGGSVEAAWQYTRPIWFPEEFYWVVGCSYQRRPEKPIEVRNPYGGCTCIRREVFDEVGGFRSGIGRVGTRPLGGEETELSIRAHQRWPERIFLYEPRAVIQHRIAEQRGHWHYFRQRCYAEGLSKAIIARFVGAEAGLSAERSYTLHDLPRGVLRNLWTGLRRHEIGYVQRAGAIILGLLTTITGYLVGTLSQHTVLTKEEIAMPVIVRATIISEA